MIQIVLDEKKGIFYIIERNFFCLILQKKNDYETDFF